MKRYRVVLKKGTNSHRLYGDEVIGHVSRLKCEEECFFFLTPSDPGVFGKDGTRIPFDECLGVYAEDEENPGTFLRRDEMLSWRQWFQQEPGYISS